jgi:xylulose-5-phosphate/fructose-6-phosphate phosphoketolase
MHAYWRAANYLSVGQIYLQDNALLEVPLTLEHIKPRLLGHWGTTPGLNLLYVHLNRLIKDNGLQRLFRQFSWPQGVPSHVPPEVPGSIHEGVS